MSHILYQPSILNEYSQFYINCGSIGFNPDLFDAIPIIKDLNKYAIIVPKKIADGFNNRKWNFDMPNEKIFGNIIRVPIIINIFNSTKIQYNITDISFPYIAIEGRLYAFFPAKLRWMLWLSYIKYIIANMRFAGNKTGNKYTEFNKYLTEIDNYLLNCIDKFGNITADGNLLDNGDIVMISNINDDYIEQSINAIRCN